jgi:hypothetical protein
VPDWDRSPGLLRRQRAVFRLLSALLAGACLAIPPARASLGEAVREAFARARRIRSSSAGPLTRAQQDSLRRARPPVAAPAVTAIPTAELRRTEFTRRGLELGWSISDSAAREVKIHRRARAGSWQYAGRAVADPFGRFTWRDTTLAPGQSVEYALELRIAKRSRMIAFPPMALPGGAGLHLQARVGTDGDLALAIELPGREPATLELYDVMGRRMGSLEIGTLGIGRHQVAVPRGRLSPPGIYLAILRQGNDIAEAKVLVTR